MGLTTLQRRFALFGWRCGRILGRGVAWAGLFRWCRLCGSKGRICPWLVFLAKSPSGRLCCAAASGGACLRRRIDAGWGVVSLQEGFLPNAPGAEGCWRPAMGLFQNMDRFQRAARSLGQGSTGLCSGRTCLPVRGPLSVRVGLIWPFPEYG